MKRVKIDENIKRLLIIFAVFFLIVCVTKPTQFLRVSNFQTMGRQMAEYGLMALGCGMCMIAGGIDLSMVYVANLTGIISGLILKNMGGSPGVIMMAVIAGLIVGAICGCINGVLVAHLKIPAMLATLGSYQLFMGVSIVITGGSTVNGIPSSFTNMATANLLGIPMPFIIFLLIIAFLSLFLSKTTFWKRVNLVGTNEKAAMFSAIKNNRVLIGTYMLSGILSSVAGLLSLARINSAKADFGTSYTMQCILIAVLGGVNPNGGFGKIHGIALAVVVLQMMSSYLNTFPTISNYYRDLIWGVVLIGVMILNFWLDKKNRAKLSAGK